MAAHLRVAVDRNHSAEQRREGVVAMLREYADLVESGEIQADEVAVLLGDFRDPDRFTCNTGWTCRPPELLLMVRMLHRDIDREMGLD